MGILVVLYEAPDCRVTAASSSAGRSIVGTGPDIIGRQLSSKERGDMPRGGAASGFTDLVARR